MIFNVNVVDVFEEQVMKKNKQGGKRFLIVFSVVIAYLPSIYCVRALSHFLEKKYGSNYAYALFSSARSKSSEFLTMSERISFYEVEILKAAVFLIIWSLVTYISYKNCCVIREWYLRNMAPVDYVNKSDSKK